MGFSTFSQKSIHGQSHVKMFSTGVLAGWVETVQQTIGAAAPFLKPQTLAYEAKEISVEHQNMLWKMIRIEIVDLHGFTPLKMVDLPIKNGRIRYPPVNCHSLLLNMAQSKSWIYPLIAWWIFPSFFVCLPEGTYHFLSFFPSFS